MARVSPPRRPNRGGAFEKWTVRLFVPVLFIALFAAMASVMNWWPDWRAWFDGPERGTWRAATFDGLDVSGAGLSVSIVDGQIVAGHDGCNSWWKDGEPDPETGEQRYMSTLVACAELPTDPAYYTLAHGDPAMVLLSENTLELRAGEHVGVFSRWTEAMAEAEREAEERAMEEARRNMPPSLPVDTVPPPSRIPPPPPQGPPPAPLETQVPPPADSPPRSVPQPAAT